MSNTPAHDPSSSDAFGQLLRGSLLPTAAAALVCVGVGLVSSPKAAYSAAFGAALVIFFFSVTLLVMRRTAELAPTTVMMVVMATYTFKVIVLGVAMFSLRNATWVSGYAVGVAITVCALVWLFFEMRAYKRLRIFAYDVELAEVPGLPEVPEAAAASSANDSPQPPQQPEVRRHDS